MSHRVTFAGERTDTFFMKGCRPLSDEEVLAVLPKIKKPRDRALFILGVRSGYRIKELLSLRLADVVQGGRIVKVIYVARRNMKKKREGRAVPVHDEAKRALARWVRELSKAGHSDPETMLFRSREGGNKAIDRRTAWLIIRKVTAAAGLTGKLGTHSMRKTFARRVHKALGNDLLKTQKAMGHKSVDSTVAYLDVDGGEIEDAILKA